MGVPGASEVFRGAAEHLWGVSGDLISLQEVSRAGGFWSPMSLLGRPMSDAFRWGHFRSQGSLGVFSGVLEGLQRISATFREVE